MKENGGTAVIITENHNGNRKNGEEKNAKRICISNIIKSIIEEQVIAEESIATISCNGTKLLICLNTNGNSEKIAVEAEIKTSIISKYFFLTQMLLQGDKKIINLQMIQKALEKNPELADTCEKFFFSRTTVEFTTKQPTKQPS